MPHRCLIAVGSLTLVLSSTLINGSLAGDWPRFRGPNGTGVSMDESPVPTSWSATENLKWKVALPGPGSSSPIVVGNRVFVTCWSGYGTGRGNPGDQQDLRRHLICIDRQTGDTLWSKTVEPYLPEDPYGGMFTQHGYASHTPVSDGERVYVFFGKTVRWLSIWKAIRSGKLRSVPNRIRAVGERLPVRSSTTTC